MATNIVRSGMAGVAGGIRTVLRGRDDARLRAVWRVLIAGTVVVPVQETTAVAVAGGLGWDGRLPFGAVQATIFALVLIGWATYIDRRPLSDYGFSLSGSWVADGIAGFVAVVVGFGMWLGVGSLSGWTHVEPAMTAPAGSVVPGLAALLVGTATRGSRRRPSSGWCSRTPPKGCPAGG